MGEDGGVIVRFPNLACIATAVGINTNLLIKNKIFFNRIIMSGLIYLQKHKRIQLCTLF